MLSPEALAGLPTTAENAPVWVRQLQAWNDHQFGRIQVSFDPHQKEEDIDMFFQGVETGTPVRVVLKDGSSLKGELSGVDDYDHMIWIRPPGIAGLISDRSFPVAQLASVGVLK
jgi:hypothetical protein